MDAKLDAIMAKLKTIDVLQADVASLKSHDRNKRPTFDDNEGSSRPNNEYRPYNKIDFPNFSGGDPRGWILKAEKYFRYYQIPEDDKIEVAAMHLEGEALDLYSWLVAKQPLMLWEELIHAFNKNFGPAEFENPDEHLISVRQTGTVQEYRQEFARRTARVSDWPDHCLLGVFIHGLKEELKTDVRIHKPRTVYSAMSLAVEFEAKNNQTRKQRSMAWGNQGKNTQSEPKTNISTPASGVNASKPPLKISDAEKQSRFLRGECFRCGDKYGPGHRCKTGTLKVYEAGEDKEEPLADFEDEEEDANEDVAKIASTPFWENRCQQR